MAGSALLLSAVAYGSANNLLLLVAAPLGALALLSVPLGWWNLRGLTVERVLPSELYAGREAHGRLQLTAGRRTAAYDLTIHDEGTTAHSTVSRLAARQTSALRVRWRFAERGRVDLVAVRIRSRWPFGLTEHVLVCPAPATLVIYPRALPSAAAARPWSGALGAEPDAAGHGTGDFVGLRPYRPGDAPRRIHWPTTARVGALLVVERAGETEVSVEVVVHPRTGARWERELSLATGEIHRALNAGRKVGLRLPPVGDQPARALPPGSGEAWRRQVLEALALLPRIP